MITVVALGGNALSRAGERGTAAEQQAHMREAVAALGPLLDGGRLVITHGNGPQVGRMLLRHERGAEDTPPHPLWLVVAETQAEIGALLAAELRATTNRPVASVVTHVVVAADDPAFDDPTKPIGPFHSEQQARELERERGWRMVEDAGRGWRRTVPSPTPLEVVEIDAVRTLVDADAIAIACGGGGIPSVRRGKRLHGVDAVIDKDLASSVLARDLGAARLVILTDVPAVYRDFGGANQEPIDRLTADEAQRLVGDLAEGSMKPKVEAAVQFVQATGGEALITSPERLDDGGTRIVP